MIEDQLDLRFLELDGDETLEQARNALTEGHTDEAFALYRSLLSEDARDRVRWPNRLDALLGLGVCHARRGEWAEALIPLSELCDLAPRFAPAWAYIGATLFELGEIDAARGDLDRAITCDPESVIARLKRAEVLLSLGLLDAAEDDLRIAARAPAPDDVTHQYARELLMNVLRRKQKAVARTVASPGDALRGLVRLARAFAKQA